MPTDELTLGDVFGGYKVNDECYVSYFLEESIIDSLLMIPRKGTITKRIYSDSYISTCLWLC